MLVCLPLYNLRFDWRIWSYANVVHPTYYGYSLCPVTISSSEPICSYTISLRSFNVYLPLHVKICILDRRRRLMDLIRWNITFTLYSMDAVVSLIILVWSLCDRIPLWGRLMLHGMYEWIVELLLLKYFVIKGHNLQMFSLPLWN